MKMRKIASTSPPSGASRLPWEVAGSVMPGPFSQGSSRIPNLRSRKVPLEPERLVQVHCVILKASHVPERVQISIVIPATPDEADVAVQAARSVASRRLYPALLPVSPQPVLGNAVYVAGPGWCGVLDECCFDTSAVDGRLFALRIPDYISRHELISRAHFREDIEVAVLVGIDQTPLQDEIAVHVFPGELITFIPAGTEIDVRYSLGQLLQSQLTWSDWPLIPDGSSRNRYCLVLEDETFLHFANPCRPTRYRDDIAATVGLPVSSIQLQAAQPQRSDVELSGYPCCTIIAVSDKRVAPPDATHFHCLIDCRPLRGEWQSLLVRQGQALQDVVLQIRDHPPLGYRLAFEGDCRSLTDITLVAGQTIVAEYVQAAAASDPTDALQGRGGTGMHASDNRATGSPVQQNESQDIDSAEEAPPDSATGAAAPTALRSFLHNIPFFLFAQEYDVEVVLATLPCTARAPEALSLVAQLREAEAHRRRPRLVPVFPQPTAFPPTALALPHWPFEGVMVLIDCQIGERRVFATTVPYHFHREDFAVIAGLRDDTTFRVFARDMPWPVLATARIYPTEGDLYVVCSDPYERGEPVTFEHVLHSSGFQATEFFLPAESADISWILSDGIYRAVPIPGDMFASDSAIAASALALPAGQFILIPSIPGVSDHANRGVPSQRVLVACQTADYPAEGPEERIPYVLDLRPLLLPLSWGYAPNGQLDVAQLCGRLALRCPRGYHVRLYGGAYTRDQGNHFRRVRPGEVVVAEFHPDYVREVVTELDPDAYTPPQDRASGHADHSTGLGPPSTTNDAGTGSSSTSQPGDGQFGSHATYRGAPLSLPSGTRESIGNSASSAYAQARTRGSSGQVRQHGHTPSKVICLLAAFIVGSSGMTVPQDFRFLDDRSYSIAGRGWTVADPHARPQCVEFACASHHDDGYHGQVAGRPLPTPCRAIRQPVILGHGTVAASPASSSTVSDELGGLQTLLQESLARPDCQAFWLSATLLEALVERFEVSTEHVATPQEPVPLRLSEVLPPAPTIDLSAVSLSLYQDLDQVVKWTTIGSWHLNPAIPDALRVPRCVQALLTRQIHTSSPPTFVERLQIYTDGSFDGATAAWAFCVFGWHHGREHFLGWAGGPVPSGSKDPLWLAPCAQHAFSGEQHALIWAAVWALQSPLHVQLSLHSDCLVALKQSNGKYGWRSGDSLAPICRAAILALTAARPTFDQEVRHVRSRSGVPQNELADQLAKYVNQSDSSVAAEHQQWAAHWIRTGAIDWLWAHVAAMLEPQFWPQQVGTALVDYHRHTDATPLTVAECHRAFGLEGCPTSSTAIANACVALRIMTLNVQSLTDAPDQPGVEDDGTGFTGRARYLREQLDEAGVQVTALQEARSPADATYVSQSHIRFCTGRDKQGNFGCELWFSRTIPFITSQGTTGKFHPKDFLTLAASPRELIVRFSRTGLHVVFACVHAPVAGCPERETWWLDLHKKLCRLCRDSVLVLAGDYNTGFSETIHSRIGDLVWPAKHPVPAGLQQILCRHDLWVPSTFGACHTGTHETWMSPTGHQGARLDYVAVPSLWCVPPAGTWVDTSLDWGQARVDHFGLGVQAYFTFSPKAAVRSRHSQFDREAMRSEEGQQKLDQICQDLPLQPWESNVHRHYLDIETRLTEVLSVAFPARRGNCRSSHFSATTWEVRQRRSWIRRQLARERKTLSLAEARAALLAWKHDFHVCVGRVLAVFPNIGTHRRFQGLVQELQLARGKLRQLIRQDVKQRVQETATAAASIPTADVVTRLRPILGPPKRRAKQRQSLTTVCGADGQAARTTEEAEELWISHFAGLEAGLKVGPIELARRIQADQLVRDLDAHILHARDVPSRAELEQALRQTQMDRAIGVDNVPGEVLHLAAGTVSKALYQLFLKVSLRVAEPIQFKGGSLHAVWKGKSSPAHCSSHRGILVSSTTGKAFHRVLRDRAVQALQHVTTDMQIGGLPRFPVVLASHFVRLFQEGSKSHRYSYGLLFLDLREAFYRVVRPLLVGTGNKDEDIAAIVKAVSLPPGVMHELYDHLQGDSLPKEAGAPPWTDLGIAEALDGTWFRFQGGQQLVRTGIGSRPGDNMADVCFSFIFAKVLASIRDELETQGLLPELPWAPQMLGEIMPVPAGAAGGLRALDTTWMDDATFLVRTDRAEALPEALAATGTAVVSACLSRALLPNLDRGKTEFVVEPVGVGSRDVRSNLFADQDPGIALHSRLWPGAMIKVVSTYRHLGGMIHHDASLVRELRHRVSLAWKAFNLRRTRVFGAPNISRSDKTVLFESLILSVLLYGAGTWRALTAQEAAIIEAAYLGMCFFMLRPALTHEEAMHAGGKRVLALLELPSLTTLLHVARLRHLLSCIQTKVPVMWSLLHWQQDWLMAARSSIEWMWNHIDRGSCTHDWKSAWDSWRSICVHQPSRWKSMIRRAQMQAVCQENWLTAVSQHRGLIGRQLRLAGAVLPECVVEAHAQVHFCAPCQAVFTTYQAWSVHAFKTHGHTAEYRQIQHGLQCQACLKHFTTHVKLCRHLQYQPGCRQILQDQGHHCPVEPGVGNRRSADEGRFQAPTLQAEGPRLQLRPQRWVHYLDRPSIEVLECLSHIHFDLDVGSTTVNVLRDRARIAFSVVCLPVRKIYSTVRVWLETLECETNCDPAIVDALRQVARWISTCDLSAWLVPSPKGKIKTRYTFRDAEDILSSLRVDTVPTPICSDIQEPTLLRVGASKWLAQLPESPVSAVDYTHEECLEALCTGRTPCFFEDPADDVIYVLSAISLPGWADRPTTPAVVKRCRLQTALATFHGDLLRFALRLWIRGIPAAFLTAEDSLVVPQPVPALPFVDHVRSNGRICLRTSGFNWEALGFTFLN